MQFITQLWLPILLSAAFVFVVSSVLHMVLRIHKGDYKKIPGEDVVRDAIRSQGLPPGEYMFPSAGSMAEMQTPEMQEKYVQGPNGFLTIVPPGIPDMGRSLMQWFAYSVLIGLFVAYVTWHGLGPGAEYSAVFHIACATAVLGYAFSYIPDSIWKGLSWTTTLKFVLDGLVYGLVTAGTFGWLWPESVA